MKKLSIYISGMAILALASFTSFSVKEEFELPHSTNQITADTILLPLLTLDNEVEEPINPELTYTVCTSEECFLASLPDVLPEEPIIPGETYTVCSFEECFSATVSDILNDPGMPMLRLKIETPLIR